ncbi:MAG: hypothetical protein E7537_00495 [Ruminococcaceae bacterium]|nr:hypothetical protein [Oscillospiraceae bacterium]
MKKSLFALFLTLILIVPLTACSNKTKGKEIPDVFGINYTDAIDILEAEGFEVKAVETSVNGIAEKLLYPLESVTKDSVFKVDDYILDNNGYLTKNYEIDDERNFISTDNSLVIYYAKEDYSLHKEETVSTKETEKSTPEVSSKTETTKKKDSNIKDKKDEKMSSNFKKAMDNYEDFMDKYIDFMKKHNKNPTDISLLTDYATYMNDYAKFVEEFEKWEDEDMNTTEAAYYLEVQSRVTKKLLEVTQ